MMYLPDKFIVNSRNWVQCVHAS